MIKRNYIEIIDNDCKYDIPDSGLLKSPEVFTIYMSIMSYDFWNCVKPTERKILRKRCWMLKMHTS